MPAIVEMPSDRFDSGVHLRCASGDVTKQAGMAAWCAIGADARGEFALAAGGSHGLALTLRWKRACDKEGDVLRIAASIVTGE